VDSTYFKRSELACKCGCGKDTVDADLLKALEDVRLYFNSPVIINSGNRCESYNKSIGGKPNSQHLVSKAADIIVKGVSPEVVHKYLLEKYLDKYGIGCYTLFTHIDVREGAARWVG
jgi:uncharacterized protein YcbK (DUF882 family)